MNIYALFYYRNPLDRTFSKLYAVTAVLATLIGAFGPPARPTLNWYDANHSQAMYYGIDVVPVQTGERDGRPECANQSRLTTPLFPSL
ncbi:hypothetical protein Y032_0166g71 [Ancylostoma ceylanicum]|nr:hypothetical protein Y032_0166g71 [Ancylostoma ceylanicum]